MSKKKDCPCYSAPDYHRDDCWKYDVHGKIKNKTIKLGSIVHAPSLEELYFKVQTQYQDHIVIMIYGTSYEILQKNGSGYGLIAANILGIKPHQKSPNDPSSPIRTMFSDLYLETNVSILLKNNQKIIILDKCDGSHNDQIPLFEYGRKVTDIRT